MKVGIIGLGKMGLLHSCILHTLPNVEVVAVCDKSMIIRRFFKKLFKNAVITDDFTKMACLNLDAIYVTTPIPSHYPILKEIYSKGIACNVFVEKTLTSSFSDSEKLCSLVKNIGGVNMVGYMKRYCVTFRKAKELLEQKIIGDITSFSAGAFSSDFVEVAATAKEPLARGGVLKDLGSHVIDLALWFFGDCFVDDAVIESVTAPGCEDVAYFRVKTRNGVSGDFAVSWCKKGYRMPEFVLSIHGNKGVIDVNDDKVSLALNNGTSRYWYRHDLSDNVEFLIGASEYYREDHAFIASIQNGSAASPSFFESLNVDYLIEQVKKKARYQ
ncbi:MAG: Gfo/Idh/MocA family protein [Candidatus Bathyarchaeales archaeon]